jgi:S-adenosylmethionine hydrolase
MQAASPNSLITLTTDFGLSDHYVGTMKGVILSGCAGARVVDISHEIAAFSLYSAAYTIDQAAPFYPRGTIHVVVIDPGVGTSRRAVLVEALGQYFVAPDNGVLSMIVARDRTRRAWEITNRSLWLAAPSSTFHGRDVFAPVAAALARGTANPADVGQPTEALELLTDLEAQQLALGNWQGRVLSVDRFGNVITNFRAAQFTAIASQPFKLRVGGGEVTQWNQTFGEAKAAECFAYFGSSGFVEVGINQASAAAFLKASPGDSISLQI